MNYERLFRLELHHEYHNNGLCNDFELRPTAATASRLKRQRMRLRTFGHGLEVLVETKSDQSLFIDLGTGISLEFTLHQTNSEFERYSTVPALTALTAQEIADRKTKFRHYDTSTLAANEYVLSTPSELVIPIADSLPYGSAWAVVSVALNASITDNIGTAPTYTIPFTARTETWKYYVLTEPTSADYQLEDGLAEFTFNKIDATVEVSPDILTQRLLDAYPDASMWRFESSTELPYTQLGRKHLNLRKDGALVIGHLPVPASTDRGVQIVKTFV